MGCHTWFKTESKYSLDEIRTLWCNKFEEWIERWRSYVDNPNHEVRVKNGIFSDYTQEQFEYFFKVYERQLRLVKKGIIKQDYLIHHSLATDEGDDYEICNGVLYVDTQNLPHDIFRIGGYPNDKLFSLDETLQFCEKKNISLSEDQINRLTKFWAENPIGMIEFG